MDPSPPLQLRVNPPLSLYIHFPWCVRKCPYCDFNSHPLPTDLPEQAFVDALLADLEADLPTVWGRPVGSLFFGGGTPSLLSPEALDRLLQGIRALIPLVPLAEITLEANPGTLEAGRFAELRAAGINRLSIGVQSFNNAALAPLGRIHSGEEARAAVEAARRAGIENLNLDLMFGLPGQTPASALSDLRIATDLAPEHISWYQLTLEPNTPFAHTPPPALPDEDQLVAIQEAGEAHLAAAGYGQYEVSAYARAGWQCRHNRNYWLFGDYLGIGPGAHGKLTSPAVGCIERTRRVAHPNDYLARSVPQRLAERSPIAVDLLPFEFMLNALRLKEGFPLALFADRTGLSPATIAPTLQAAEQKGMLQVTAERIAPTLHGWRFLNDLIALFLPD